MLPYSLWGWRRHDAMRLPLNGLALLWQGMGDEARLPQFVTVAIVVVCIGMSAGGACVRHVFWRPGAGNMKLCA